jgi:hypothetical protein
MDLETLSGIELLQLYARTLDTLKRKGITRSTNNPVADYAEAIVAKGLGPDLTAKSNAGYDAIHPETGMKYEIKARRPTKTNKSTQMSAIRNLDKAHFDYLVAVIFAEDFSVDYAALIPIESVRRLASYVAHTNSHKLMVPRSIFTNPGVENVTKKIDA